MNKCEKLHPAARQTPETDLALACPSKCENIQLLLLENPDSPEAAAHLADCPACAEFAKLEKAFRNIPDNAPASPSLAWVMNKRRKPAWLRIGVPLGAAAAFVGMVALLGLEMPREAASPRSAGVPAMTEDETSELSVWSVTLPATTENSTEVEASETLPAMAWDSSDIENIETEFEQIETACNWNIPVFNPVYTEGKEVVQ